MDSIMEEMSMSGHVEIHDDEDHTVYVYEQIMEDSFMSIRDHGLMKFTRNDGSITRRSVSYAEFAYDIATFQADNKYTMMTDLLCDDPDFDTQIKRGVIKPTEAMQMKLQLRFRHDGTYPQRPQCRR